jgi:hypothetical protein
MRFDDSDHRNQEIEDASSGEGYDACDFEGSRCADAELGWEDGCNVCAVGAGEGLGGSWIARLSALIIGSEESVLHFREREKRILASR